MTTDSTPTRVLVSFAEADNKEGWVKALLNELNSLAHGDQKFDFVERSESQPDTDSAGAGRKS